MNKLRSDSAFCQLTPQQADTLEGWLFEERLSYRKVVERLKAEFGLETSLTGVRRFYKRLDLGRSRQSLVDVVETSGWAVEALKGGNLKPGMLLLANKCAFELMMKSDPPIRKVTALLRAITSSEAHTMRQTVRDQEEAELRERKRLKEVEESWRITPWDLEQEREDRRQERAARKKAKLEAAEKAASPRAETDRTASADQFDAKMNLPTPHPGPMASQARHESVSRKELCASRNVVPVEGRGSGSVPVVPACPQPSDSLAPRGTSGERAGLPAVALAKGGERGICISTKDDGDTWQPSVVEEREYAENHLTEEAENRLTPHKILRTKMPPRRGLLS